MPSIAIRPGRGHQRPGDHIEQGRLAGAVGPDQPDDLPGLERQIDLVERPQPREILDRAFDHQRAGRIHTKLGEIGRLGLRTGGYRRGGRGALPAPLLVELPEAEEAGGAPIHHQQDEHAEPRLGQAEGRRHGEAEEIEAALQPAQDLDGEGDHHRAAQGAADGGLPADDQHGQQSQGVVEIEFRGREGAEEMAQQHAGERAEHRAHHPGADAPARDIDPDGAGRQLVLAAGPQLRPGDRLPIDPRRQQGQQGEDRGGPEPRPARHAQEGVAAAGEILGPDDDAVDDEQQPQGPDHRGGAGHARDGNADGGGEEADEDEGDDQRRQQAHLRRRQEAWQRRQHARLGGHAEW